MELMVLGGGGGAKHKTGYVHFGGFLICKQFFQDEAIGTLISTDFISYRITSKFKNKSLTS